MSLERCHECDAEIDTDIYDDGKYIEINITDKSGQVIATRLIYICWECNGCYKHKDNKDSSY